MTKDLWAQFHLCWGQAHDHEYVKEDWMQLQRLLIELQALETGLSLEHHKEKSPKPTLRLVRHG
jgi:hypothetical protein